VAGLLTIGNASKSDHFRNWRGCVPNDLNKLEANMEYAVKAMLFSQMHQRFPTI
jgi:hypothetical protein